MRPLTASSHPTRALGALGHLLRRGLALAALAAQLACTGGPDDAAPLPPLPPPVGEGPTPAGPERPVRELLIAWTGELRGEIDPCGCPTVPYGGFERRARLLAQLREQGPPLFVLDAGDMLAKGEITAGSVDRVGRARAVLDLAALTRLDAWVPSPDDLQLLRAAPDGAALAARTGALGAGEVSARVLERGGLRLGVVGLPREPRGDGPPTAEAVWVEQVRAAVASLGEVDTTVLLTNAPEALRRSVAEAVPGIAAVLGTRAGVADDPQPTAGATLFETTDRGRYVTLLRVALGSDGRPWEAVSRGPLVELGDERARVASLPPGPSRDEAARTLPQREAAVAAAARGRNLVSVVHRPLGSDLDGEREVAARIATWKGETLAAAKERVEEAPSGPRYASAGTCFSCHERRFAAWALDPHKGAMLALNQRGRGQDVECVGCHTTGFGEPGGFAELSTEALATWRDVQCEACHGPMGGHPGDARVHSRAVGRDTCVRCHDAANSPQFDYDTWRTRVSCWSVSQEEKGRGGDATPSPTP